MLAEGYWNFGLAGLLLFPVVGGVLLVILGLAMVTGVWGAWMSSLQGVMSGVQLPL